MAARIDKGRAQLLTRTGLDWTGKYPSVIAALENLKVKAAYIDGELCGVTNMAMAAMTTAIEAAIVTAMATAREIPSASATA